MTLSGRPFSGDGILRNRAYVGEIVWNRRMRVVDPTSGQAQRSLNNPNERVPRITVEGQLARMLAAAQPDLSPHATQTIARAAKAAAKEEQGAEPLAP